MESHRKAIDYISLRVQDFYSRGEKFRIYHGTTGSTRAMSFDRDHIIDTSELNNVLMIDDRAKTAIVEPNVSMDVLVKVTIKKGLLPPVVPELCGLTVGGCFAGSAGESSSFKYGPFDHTVRRFEIVLANGKVKECSKDQNEDLFWGAAGSCGILGIVTLLEIGLIDAKSFVELAYHREENVTETRQKLQDEMDNLENDFVEGIMFSRNKGVVMVGRLTDTPSPGCLVQRFSRAWDNWFYLHAEQLIDKGSVNPPSIAIPLEDYLFRHDRGTFWAGAYCFQYFKMPFNRLTRYLLNFCMHSRRMYHALHRSGIAQDYICQDMLIPASQTDAFITSISSLWGIYPLSICGINAGIAVPVIYNSTQFDADGRTKEKIFNVGMYGPRKLLTHTAEDENRILEDIVAKHQGAKWLYADSYYSKDEFRRIYDMGKLERLRKKYDATSMLDLYEKTRTLPFPRSKNHWFWKMRPLPGITGALSALKGGNYLLRESQFLPRMSWSSALRWMTDTAAHPRIPQPA